MKISRDINGNKILKIESSDVNGERGFSIQTLGNLPETHRKGICEHTMGEVFEHVHACGTPRQKGYFNIYPIGTKYKTRGKHPKICTVTDFLTVTNLKGEIVKTYYESTHEFCGQTVKNHEVSKTTIAMGLLK